MQYSRRTSTTEYRSIPTLFTAAVFYPSAGHRASTRKSLYLSPKNMQRHHTHDDDEAASLRMMLDDVDAAVGPSRSAEDNVFGDDTDHSSDVRVQVRGAANVVANTSGACVRTSSCLLYDDVA